MSNAFDASFKLGGHTYRIAVLDEPDVDLDPTFLVFRDDEEEAVITAHLDPNMLALCGEDEHVVVRPIDD